MRLTRGDGQRLEDSTLRAAVHARLVPKAGGMIDRAAAALAAAARERVLDNRAARRPLPSVLAQSITARRTGPARALVEAGAPHAVFVELGTRRYPGEPFMGPAVAALVAGGLAALPDDAVRDTPS